MIDLHIHSTGSDGSLTPQEVVKLAKEKGLRAVSITDHDSVSGVRHVLNSEIIEVIPGVELSGEYKGKEVHVLGYFIDVNNQELLASLEYLRQRRLTRADRILEKLEAMGMSIKREEIPVQGVIARPNIAEVMVKKGFVKDYKEAFTEYLATGAKAFVKKERFTFDKSVSLIINARGIPILAHPGEIKTDDVKPFLDYAFVTGVQGIEVFHPSNDKKMRKLLLKYCKEKGLLITGGSDFHGKGEKNELGIEDIPYSYLEEIKKRL